MATEKHVLISYTPGNDLAYARLLAADLEQHGYSTWFDARDAERRGDHGEQVEEALRDAGAMVVLASPALAYSTAVLVDAEQAHRAGVPLFGLRLADVDTDQAAFRPVQEWYDGFEVWGEVQEHLLICALKPLFGLQFMETLDSGRPNPAWPLAYGDLLPPAPPAPEAPEPAGPSLAKAAVAEPPPLAAGPPPLAPPLPPPLPPQTVPGDAPPPLPASRSAKPLILAAAGVAAVVAIVLTLYFTGVFGGRDRDSFSDRWPSTSSGARGSSGFASQTESGMGPSAAAPVAPPTATPCPGVVPAAEFGAYASDGVPAHNRLAIGPGPTLTWNEASINAITLRQYLDISQTLSPRPILVSRLDPAADPVLVESVRDAIDQALGCRGARL
jgi:hypothetical protein